MRMRRGGCAALALGTALLTGACTAPPGAEPSPSASDAAPPSAAPAVLMEMVQLRGDVASGHIELRVTNESDASLTVVRATYESSRWSAAMVREDEAVIPAGQRRNLRMQLPEPTCDTGPIEHVASIELADGTRIERAPADPLDQLQRLGVDVCDLRTFEQRIAALEWLEPEVPMDGSGPAVLRLEVTPVQEPGEHSGAIEAIAATVLLTPVDASGTRLEQLPVGLAIERGDAATVVELPLEPGRCDLHAIAEDKQGTILRLRARMDDEPIDLLLASPEQQREALLDWAVARCAAQP